MKTFEWKDDEPRDLPEQWRGKPLHEIPAWVKMHFRKQLNYQAALEWERKRQAHYRQRNSEYVNERARAARHRREQAKREQLAGLEPEVREQVEAAHREKRRKDARAWREANRDRYREYQREYHRKRRAKLREDPAARVAKLKKELELAEAELAEKYLNMETLDERAGTDQATA